jgi:acyl-CoA oxidase
MSVDPETAAAVTDLIDNEYLAPLVPMIYVAWADGDLTDRETERIRGKAARETWLEPDEQRVLGQWLDPEDPPTARQMNRLLAWLRSVRAEMSADERCSLADLGVRIAELDFEETEPDDQRDRPRRVTRQALEDLEDALGVHGRDACAEMIRPVTERPKMPVDEEDPVFDISRMTSLLDGEYADIKNRVRELLQRPEFTYRWEMPRAEFREEVLRWTHIVADEGLGRLAYPEAQGGENDMGAFMSTFETLAMFDQNLVVKYGVQFGLFGGSIQFLGTETHHEQYLERVGNLELPGGFAMTEFGHGSNVRDIETTARFDAETDEFVIDTPSDSARKEWIGNAAEHGRMVTTFAQLEVDGESYGVHAFLVPIRDDDGDVVDDVRIEDCGHKLGLNGIDNGRIWFDSVRIPRENLLDRHAHVTEDGEYESPIPSATKRFFTMVGTLVGGRVSVAAASVTAMKTALSVATRYGARRRQFGPAGEAEVPILDYRTHQRRLMPRIAKAYGLSFAVNHLKDRYLDRTGEDQREVEALAAGMKAYASWAAVDAVQESREACGGMGYLTENRIPELRKNLDIYTTFEGDNTVLMLLVARGLLTQFRNQFEDDRVFGLVRYVAQQASTAVQELNPVVTRTTDTDHLRGADFQLGAFRYRAESLTQSAARRLQARLGDESISSYEAFNQVQDHLVSLAHAHIERVILEQFQAKVEETPEGPEREILTLLRTTFALDRVYDDAGWFLESGYIEPPKARAIRTELNELCGEMRRQAVPLVDAFGIPRSCLAAPIAFEADRV